MQKIRAENPLRISRFSKTAAARQKSEEGGWSSSRLFGIELPIAIVVAALHPIEAIVRYCGFR